LPGLIGGVQKQHDNQPPLPPCLRPSPESPTRAPGLGHAQPSAAGRSRRPDRATGPRRTAQCLGRAQAPCGGDQVVSRRTGWRRDSGRSQGRMHRRLLGARSGQPMVDEGACRQGHHTTSRSARHVPRTARTATARSWADVGQRSCEDSPRWRCWVPRVPSSRTQTTVSSSRVPKRTR